MSKKEKSTKIILSLFIIGVLIFGGAFGYTFYELGKINTVKISKTDEDLGIKTDAAPQAEKDNGITNIAFFGLDRRTEKEPARSDSIMVLSVDTKNKKIKMSSIMRDTYVAVKGHDETKINHAYAYGGPQLAIRTLNENFDLNIRNYVSVDFFNLEKIIDSINGVTIDVAQDEVNLMNDYMNETARIEGKSISRITSSGPQTLNGLQAVAYSRIRYTSGGDFKRTERQRTVLTGMLTKIQSLGATEFPSVVSKLLPLTETSMSSMDVMALGTKVIASKTTALEQERFPVDGYCEGKTIGGVWYLKADLKATTDQIHKFIYEDAKPVSKTPLF
ncbi:LCP family protein [Clostridium estertheticum]|uniref:LCP family protein n=1 Tax=Clostridium estertheticum TaxID=238834 RepID=UPI0013EE89B1|nr:LCP family protein [Clostridium estertheticum]MBZ9609299.1 LCP family protein [Clostridium estertheticum]